MMNEIHRIIKVAVLDYKITRKKYDSLKILT